MPTTPDQHRLMFDNIRERFQAKQLPHVPNKIESPQRLKALQSELQSLTATISNDYQAINIIEQRIHANEQRCKDIFDILGAATQVQTIVPEIDSKAGDILYDQLRKLGQQVEIIYFQDKRKCKIVERKICTR